MRPGFTSKFAGKRKADGIAYGQPYGQPQAPPEDIRKLHCK